MRHLHNSLHSTLGSVRAGGEEAGGWTAEESPVSLAEKGVTVEEKSLVMKGGMAKVARLRRNLLGPLIKCIFV
jgi:hypothetical protein